MRVFCGYFAGYLREIENLAKSIRVFGGFYINFTKFLAGFWRVLLQFCLSHLRVLAGDHKGSKICQSPYGFLAGYAGFWWETAGIKNMSKSIQVFDGVFAGD